MKTITFIGTLLASTALAACGGGSDDSASSDSSAGTQAAADDVVETVAEETQSAADDTMDAAEDAAEEVVEDAADEAEAPGEEEAASDDAAEEQPADEGGAFMVAGLTGDAAAGRRVFARCMSCHVLEEGVNRVGPSLYGIVGREAGSIEGFRYSEANANSGVTWTEENLFEYLENPREFIPGTIMAFPGLPDGQDRADLIAYIKENGGDAN